MPWKRQALALFKGESQVNANLFGVWVFRRYYRNTIEIQINNCNTK